MRKLILIMLIISCSKVINVSNFKNKGIDEDLAIAIINDEKEKAIELISQGANVNYKYNGKSIFELSLDNRNLEITKELVKKEAEINKNDVVKIYDLALEDFNYDIIDLIKDKYKLEEGLIDNNKYFLLLCYTSNAKEVKRFIEKNEINPKEVKDKINRNGLILSAVGNKLDILKMLIEEYKINVNSKNNNGSTPLTAACTKNDKKIVELLIEKGANINDRDNYGWTALMRASENGNLEIAKLLIEKGANVNDQDNKSWTALMVASKEGHIEVVKLLERIN